MPSCGVEARKFAMCMAQLLSSADVVDVGAGLTHEEGDLFSIVTSARTYEATRAVSSSSSSSRKQKLLFFDAVLCCLDGMGVKKALLCCLDGMGV